MGGIFNSVGRLLKGQNKQSKQNVLEIAGVLNRAFENHTKMDIQITAEDKVSRYIRGVCVSIKDDALLIDVTLEHPVTAWVGQLAHVYFQLKGPKRWEYFDFYSPIIDMPRYEQGYAMRVAVPKMLNHNQKRTFVRLEPPLDLVSEAFLWYLPIDKDLPKDIFALPDFPCVGDAQVKDISGGGVRLFFATENLLMAQLAAGNHCLLHLIATGIEGKGKLDIWLECEIVMMRSVAHDKTATDFSFKFHKWAINPATDSDEFSWFPPEKDGGVPPVVTWVIRKHLELHRNK